MVWGRPSRLVSPDQDSSIPPMETAVLGVGRQGARLKAYTRLRDRLAFRPLLHPHSSIASTAEVMSGSVACWGAVVSANASVGHAVLLNWHVTIGHDAVIGDGVVVNPHAAVSGGVRVDEGALIGAHAVILEGVHVGRHALIGAGSVVTRDVAPGATVMGVPARQRRTSE